MTTYVSSDHHFNHKNIIEYCDRNFRTVDEMNSVMIEKWNDVVNEDDAVIHVGDIAYTDSEETVEDYLNRLNGNITLIEGNHDSAVDISTISIPFAESMVIRKGKYRFFVTHRFESVPDSWTEWIIHGHSHNNTPFIRYDKNSVNVSVDVTDYKPVSLTKISSILDDMGNGQSKIHI